MSKSKVQASVAFVSRGSKIMFFLLLGHSIPLLITTPGDKSRQYVDTNQECEDRVLPVDHNIEDLAKDKGTDVPANKADENLVAGKVEGSRDVC